MKALVFIVLCACAALAAASHNGTITVTTSTPKSAAGGWTVTLSGVPLAQYPNSQIKVRSTGNPTDVLQDVSGQSNVVSFQMPQGMGTATLSRTNNTHDDQTVMYDTVIGMLSTNSLPESVASVITITGSTDFDSATQLASQPSMWSASANGAAASIDSVTPATLGAGGKVIASIPGQAAGVVSLTLSAKTVALNLHFGSCTSSCLKSQGASPSISMVVTGTVATFDANNFKSKLKQLMNLGDVNQIYIVSINPGSVVVVFRVLNSDTQTNAASGAQAKLEQLASDGTLSKELGTESLQVGSTTVAVKKQATTTEDDDDDEVPAGLIGGIVGGIVGGILLIGVAYFIFKRTSGGQGSFRNYGQKKAPGPAFSQPSTQTDNEVGLV